MTVAIGACLLQLVAISFKQALLLAGGMVCAINAFMDRDEMGIVETYVSGIWLIAMFILTPRTLYWLATIREFANR
jgi:hypothetical protein